VTLFSLQIRDIHRILAQDSTDIPDLQREGARGSERGGAGVSAIDTVPDPAR